MTRVGLTSEAILRSCADYLLSIQRSSGFFVPSDSKHQEIAIYQIESTWTLLEAYRAFGQTPYLEAAARTLDRFSALQRSDGTVPHAPLPASYYQQAREAVFEYTLSRLERDGQAYPGSDIDPRTFARMGVTDGGLAMAARAFALAAGEDRYRQMARRAMDHYCAIWNPAHLKEHHFVTFYGLSFALVAFDAWRGIYPRAGEMVDAITQLLTEGPVWWGYSPSKLAIVGVGLLTVHGRRYADSHLRPALEELLQTGLEVTPGGYGMATGSGQQWGRYADIRGTVPLMIAMKAYDTATDSHIFTERASYQRMLGWLERNQAAAQAAGRPFFEIQREDGHWFGSGTPVYLAAWWALGRFAPL
jgi:hypothetical protein